MNNALLVARWFVRINIELFKIHVLYGSIAECSRHDSSPRKDPKRFVGGVQL